MGYAQLSDNYISPESLKIPTMYTLNQASAATGLSYDFLRKLCLSKKIVHIRAGTKILVNMEKLIDYLNGEEVGGNDETHTFQTLPGGREKGYSHRGQARATAGRR